MIAWHVRISYGVLVTSKRIVNLSSQGNGENSKKKEIKYIDRKRNKGSKEQKE